MSKIFGPLQRSEMQKVWKLIFPSARTVRPVRITSRAATKSGRRLNCHKPADQPSPSQMLPNARMLAPPSRPFPAPNLYSTTYSHRHAATSFHVSRSSNMDLGTLSTKVAANPSLSSMPLDGLLLFLASAAAIKNNILLLQPSDHSPDAAPDVLPRSAQAFLSQACNLPISNILGCWLTFKDIIWHANGVMSLLHAPLSTFHEHGTSRGFSTSALCFYYWTGTDHIPCSCTNPLSPSSLLLDTSLSSYAQGHAYDACRATPVCIVYCCRWSASRLFYPSVL